MASILDRYGIKEVADVTFYKIDPKTGDKKEPVLFLDTLKVSTIEQTAETADARGGKGNPKLVTWDYGKEITVTIEDALFSAKSMAIMFGDGKVTSAQKGDIFRTVMGRTVKDGSDLKVEYIMGDVLVDGSATRKKLYFETAKGDGILFSAATPAISIEKVVDEEGGILSLDTATGIVTAGTNLNPGEKAGTPEEGDRVFVTYKTTANTNTISITAETFPGTYYVAGDTYARSDIDGSDQFFQFIIPKAKVTSENTITLEAEGDPAVFNMNLTVLRPEDGEMMKLVQYELAV